MTLRTPDEIPKSVEIYYTLNGDDPDEGSNVYREPILLASEDGKVNFYPVKVRLCFKGEFSDTILEKTYIVGETALDTFGINLVSLTIDNDSLYNYYTGIFANGYVYDRKVAEGRTGRIIGNQGERGDEWIRNGHIVMFDPNGNVMIDQNVGVGVSGQSSCVLPVKSLRVIADEQYDTEHPNLEFAGFYDERTEAPFSMVNTYNSIKLRGGSQDYDLGNIRSSIASRLCYESGFDGYSESERAIVFLNGKIYGVFDIQQRFVGSFLAKHFDLDNSDAIIENDSKHSIEHEVLAEMSVSEYFYEDLNIDENREKLEQVVDMDNFLLYYALEILMNNTDWPQSNYNVWKYIGERDPENPYADGRIRFLLDDTDAIFYADSNPQYFKGISEDVLVSLMEGKYRTQYNGENSVFCKVMESKVYRDRFVTIICDLLNSSFQAENLVKIIDEEYEKIRHAEELFLGEYYVEEYSDNYIEILKQEACSRENEIREAFAKYWGLEEQYEFRVSTSEGISISWGNTSLPEESSFSNIYYSNTQIDISMKVYPGYIFSHWLVNGEECYSDTLTIDYNCIRNGVVEIKAVAHAKSEGNLIISELYSKGASDWIKLTAVGTVPVFLSDYFLSDNKDSQKFQLPNLVLYPEESIIIHGKHAAYDLGEYICNFSINNTETLTLFDASRGVIVDSIRVPRMEESETYGRYKEGTQFAFFTNKDGERKKSTY